MTCSSIQTRTERGRGWYLDRCQQLSPLFFSPSLPPLLCVSFFHLLLFYYSYYSTTHPIIPSSLPSFPVSLFLFCFFLPYLVSWFPSSLNFWDLSIFFNLHPSFLSIFYVVPPLSFPSLYFFPSFLSFPSYNMFAFLAFTCLHSHSLFLFPFALSSSLSFPFSNFPIHFFPPLLFPFLRVCVSVCACCWQLQIISVAGRYTHRHTHFADRHTAAPGLLHTLCVSVCVCIRMSVQSWAWQR